MNHKLKIILIVLSIFIIGFFLFWIFSFSSKKTNDEEQTERIINLFKETKQKVFEFVLPQKQKEPTPSPENKTFLCYILDQEFCNQGRFVYDYNGYLVGIGFKLPKGTKIYAPFKGELEAQEAKVQIEGNVYRASVLLDTSSDNWANQGTRTIFTALGFHQLVEKDKTDFSKGEIFVLSGDSPVEPKLGDYNLILNFRVFYLSSEQWYTHINLLREFFNESLISSKE
jgi:hypothetical protein